MSTTHVRKKTRVAIVGAGFSGLWAAKRLTRKDAANRVEVALIDRNNYHTFPPLLYQVAAAELEPESIAYPIRGIFRGKHNVNPILADVKGLDLDRRLVLTEGPDIPYDYLVLAAGSQTSHYGVPGALLNSFGLKTLEESVALRNHILACFERATIDEDAPPGLLTVAVVGGGATGIEYAGALAELMAKPLRNDFPKLAGRKPKVVILDSADEILKIYPKRLRVYARKKLEGMGVEVRSNSHVAEVMPNAVRLDDGAVVEACTIVWTAGVEGEVLGRDAGLPLGRSGRVEVQPTLQLPGRPEVYVAGDFSLPEGQNPPMLAQNALQQGTLAAENILRAMDGQEPKEYRYRDRGTMVTIGRSSAVAQVGPLGFTGYPAWLLWLFIHLAYLIGFRNKILALMSWSRDYFLNDRAVRLILPRVESVLAVCGVGRQQVEIKSGAVESVDGAGNVVDSPEGDPPSASG